MVRIAMMQMLVQPNQPNRNLLHMRELLAQVQGEADIAVFPECCDIGWTAGTVERYAESIPGGRRFQPIRRLAIESGLDLVVGLTERDGSHCYNTAVYVDRMGRLLGKHRKINLVADVETMYLPGTSISVFDTRFGRIGIDICADNHGEATVIAEAMRLMGAELVLSPCSWAVPVERLGEPYGEEWLTPFRRLYDRIGLPIIAVSNIGPVEDGAWAGWQCIGNSIASTSDVTVLPYGVDAETVRIVEV